jgi:hypothetical protein
LGKEGKDERKMERGKEDERGKELEITQIKDN